MVILSPYFKWSLHLKAATGSAPGAQNVEDPNAGLNPTVQGAGL